MPDDPRNLALLLERRDEGSLDKRAAWLLREMAGEQERLRRALEDTADMLDSCLADVEQICEIRNDLGPVAGPAYRRLSDAQDGVRHARAALERDDG